MNFPFLKHPKSAQAFHKTNNHLEELISKEQELERSQDEFLSIASHELRTPLTTIKGNTSIIKQYFWNQIPGGELRGMINDIDEASDRMLKLVNNFLDTLRLEQSLVKFDLKNIDFSALVKDVIDDYQTKNQKSELKFNIIDPNISLPHVSADLEWSKKLLGYMLDNALKYTDRGTITINFNKEADFLRIIISDTGHGIEPEAQKSLFKKFAQTSKDILTRDTVQGTGLGLYLAKLIADQMRGDVRLESSELGRGSTFSITLPLAK